MPADMTCASGGRVFLVQNRRAVCSPGGKAARGEHRPSHANAPFNSSVPTPAASPAHQKGEWLQNAECPPWRCSKGPSKAAEDETQMRCSVPRQWLTERPGRELELSFSWQSPCPI